MSKHKIPLVAGSRTFGLSLNDITVTASGAFGIYGNPTDGEEKKLTEQTMWEAYSNFGTFLSSGDKDTKFELFVYYDSSGGGTYRKFKSVRPVSFAANIGDENNKLFSYTLQLLIEDPTIYTSAPGA